MTCCSSDTSAASCCTLFWSLESSDCQCHLTAHTPVYKTLEHTQTYFILLQQSFSEAALCIFNLVSLSGKDLDSGLWHCARNRSLCSATLHSTSGAFILNQILSACSCLHSAEFSPRDLLIQIELCWATLSVARNIWNLTNDNSLGLIYDFRLTGIIVSVDAS